MRIQFTPYLTFDGRCAEAFRFYEQCLGGEIVMMLTFGETPAAAHVPEEARNQVMHARLVVGDAVLMGSDSGSQAYAEPAGIQVALQVDDPADGERIFEELSVGGTVTMAFEETFWARRFGMVTDRFGIPWMVNCEHPS